MTWERDAAPIDEASSKSTLLASLPGLTSRNSSNYPIVAISCCCKIRDTHPCSSNG